MKNGGKVERLKKCRGTKAAKLKLLKNGGKFD